MHWSNLTSMNFPLETKRDIVTLFTFAISKLSRTPETFREYMTNSELNDPSPTRL